MRALGLGAILLSAALGLPAGCSTQSHTPGNELEAMQLEITGGDHIRVVTTRRERIGLKITEVRGDRFVGVTLRPRKKETLPKGQPVEVLFDEIALLEVTHRGQKALAASAVAVVTVVAFEVIGQIGVMPAP
jgi:hypothetical protein